MHCVQCSNVTPQRLQHKGRHSVADISDDDEQCCCPKPGIIAIDNSPINHLHVSQQESPRCGLERRNPTWLAIAKTRVSGTGKSVDMAKIEMFWKCTKKCLWKYSHIFLHYCLKICGDVSFRSRAREKPLSRALKPYSARRGN
jgi:hypothetical protein